MWVRHLSLTNFRGFASLELDLDRPVTVLIGVNGSGKSSVLRAIAAPLPWVHAYADGASPASLMRPQGMFVDERDLRAGTASSAIVSRFRHGGDFQVRVWKEPENLQWFGAFGDNTPLHWFDQLGRPFMFLADTSRQLTTASVREPDATEALPDARARAEDGQVVALISGYGRFLEWFKEREDAENARRVQRRDLDLQDPQLRVVREAVAALMPGFENLRIERDPSPAMVVTKGAFELRLDQLSDGERNLIALAGDLARRLVIAHPDHASPREVEAVILIDEIEQHLHPALQRKVIPSLQRAFPNAQLIVTTHSPQVLSSVPASAVVVLDNFEAHAVTGPTQGRDTNAILREVFGVETRPEMDAEALRGVAALIEDERLDEALARLDTLAEKLSEHDDEVLRLRTTLDFARAGL